MSKTNVVNPDVITSKPTMTQIVGTSPVVTENHKVLYDVHVGQVPVFEVYATQGLDLGMVVRIKDDNYKVIGLVAQPKLGIVVRPE